MDPAIAPFYTAAWVAAAVTAALLVARSPRDHALTRAAYWRGLLTPWKVTTFAVAAAALVVAGPYSGDPTWDAPDAIMMSVLTFLTAPWVTGVLFRVARRRLPAARLGPAVCAWLLSASWSYDAYIWARDGIYPQAWLSSLVASSVLYFAGGLLWNLEWSPAHGVRFWFQRDDWPVSDPASRFRGLALWALVFMALVAAALAPIVLGIW